MKLTLIATVTREANKYIVNKPGHKDSKGKPAPWCVVDKKGKIIGSHATKELAEKAFRGMEMNKHAEYLPNIINKRTPENNKSKIEHNKDVEKDEKNERFSPKGEDEKNDRFEPKKLLKDKPAERLNPKVETDKPNTRFEPRGLPKDEKNDRFSGKTAKKEIPFDSASHLKAIWEGSVIAKILKKLEAAGPFSVEEGKSAARQALTKVEDTFISRYSEEEWDEMKPKLLTKIVRALKVK
jgi:hypothetical protein